MGTLVYCANMRSRGFHLLSPFLDKYGMKNRVLALVLVLAIISLIASSLAVAIIAPSSSLVSALTGVTDTPANPAAKATTNHGIAFTTEIEGVISYVDIDFPVGFDVSGATLVLNVGIGDGTVSPPPGQTVRYTVTAPATVTAGTAITIVASMK